MIILELIYSAIDELNEDLEAERKLNKQPNTKLFGEGSVLDSIELVGLITLIEERLEEKFSEYIPIADERALSLEENPFNNVESLSTYIKTIINERK